MWKQLAFEFTDISVIKEYVPKSEKILFSGSQLELYMLEVCTQNDYLLSFLYSLITEMPVFIFLCHIGTSLINVTFVEKVGLCIHVLLFRIGKSLFTEIFVESFSL